VLISKRKTHAVEQLDPQRFVWCVSVRPPRFFAFDRRGPIRDLADVAPGSMDDYRVKVVVVSRSVRVVVGLPITAVNDGVTLGPTHLPRWVDEELDRLGIPLNRRPRPAQLRFPPASPRSPARPRRERLAVAAALTIPAALVVWWGAEQRIAAAGDASAQAAAAIRDVARARNFSEQTSPSQVLAALRSAARAHPQDDAEATGSLSLRDTMRVISSLLGELPDGVVGINQLQGSAAAFEIAVVFAEAEPARRWIDDLRRPTSRPFSIDRIATEQQRRGVVVRLSCAPVDAPES
jgi:hypothetical protein